MARHVYHLTCPTCKDVTDSPFVRSGAVVRCTACEHKYRIKSSHFEREVLTGPRTLDETDAVLRSDSVDIDPDEVAPVSIDDEGNVVGLSGLSELMRWSDAEGKGEAQKEKLKARAEEEAGGALKEARPVGTKAKSKSKSKSKSKPAREEMTGRERAQQRRRKKKTNTLMLASLSVLLVIGVGVVVMMLVGGPNKPEDGGAEDDTPPVVDNDPGPKPPDPGPDPPDPGPDRPDVDVFPLPKSPSPNPDMKFVAPWPTIDDTLPPEDVPTVLTPAKPITLEGWYVMSPPRGSADAVGVSNVELGELTPNTLGKNQTLLTGSVSNRTTRSVLSGELHVMLLDSTGRVFAETYTPLVMIEPGGKQAISLPIATRHWKRSRGVRAGVTVTDWADALSPMRGVQLDPVGRGRNASLRVSVQHNGDRSLRNVLILVHAEDAQGRSVARFLIDEKNLDIRPGQWLDLVVSTPLPEGRLGVTWSAVLQPR